MSEREQWLLTIEPPAGMANTGRFMARLLKHLRRAWGVRCTALDHGAEVRRLRAIANSLADRCARQAELLARRAERLDKSAPTVEDL